MRLKSKRIKSLTGDFLFLVLLVRDAFSALTGRDTLRLYDHNRLPDTVLECKTVEKDTNCQEDSHEDLDTYFC